MVDHVTRLENPFTFAATRWIIGADAVHHLFLGKGERSPPWSSFSLLAGDFKREYPDAKLIAVDEAIKKKGKEGLKFDGGMRMRLPLITLQVA